MKKSDHQLWDHRVDQLQDCSPSSQLVAPTRAPQPTASNRMQTARVCLKELESSAVSLLVSASSFARFQCEKKSIVQTLFLNCIVKALDNGEHVMKSGVQRHRTNAQYVGLAGVADYSFRL
mmetsp:Transcript_24352/g.95928  ORF Transcript_24352/g.95928 Transcript_24352/m.95928 type:complete len:121 (+) Transcript_24352:1060-1422(+)